MRDTREIRETEEKLRDLTPKDRDEILESLKLHDETLTPRDREEILGENKLLSEEEIQEIIEKAKGREFPDLETSEEESKQYCDSKSVDNPQLSERPEIIAVLDSTPSLSTEPESKRFRFTATEGRRIRDELLENLDGMECIEDVKERLSHLFFSEEVMGWKEFTDSYQKTHEYFQVLEALPHNDRISDIAEKVNIDGRLVRSWIRDLHMPSLLRVALSIPSEIPTKGKKWLPLEAKGKKFSKFIEVPSELANEYDFTELLRGIESIHTPVMHEYERTFGGMDKPNSLMYLLGLYISDGSPVSHTITQSLGIVSSRKYSWSNEIGQAFVYALGKMGIHSSRIKDKVFTNSEGKKFRMRQWLSSTSPLLSYLGRMALGLGSEAKVYSKISMDWIQNIPEEWRISLLQGISDGDGFVSNNWYVGISSASHRKPISSLLKSLGIHSNEYDGEIRICRYEDIKKMSRYMFKHASSRQDELENLLVRMENSRRYPYTERELHLLSNLRREGMSFAKISEVLWEKYQISRRPAGLALKYEKLYYASKGSH